MALLTETAKKSLPQNVPEPAPGIIDVSNLERLPKLTASMRSRVRYVRDLVYKKEAYAGKSPRVLQFMHLVFRYMGSQFVCEHRGVRDVLGKLDNEGANFEAVMSEFAKMFGAYALNDFLVQTDAQPYAGGKLRLTGLGKIVRSCNGILLAIRGVESVESFSFERWAQLVAAHQN